MNGQYIDQGNLYITDGYVSKISTKLESFDEEVTIEANYSNYGSTTIDIDWTKAKEHDEPTSFQEANSSLYNEWWHGKSTMLFLTYMQSQDGIIQSLIQIHYMMPVITIVTLKPRN